MAYFFKGVSRPRMCPKLFSFRRSLSTGTTTTIPTNVEPDASAPGFHFCKLAVIGGGKMAEAILEAIKIEKLIETKSISVFDVNKERLSYLKEAFGVKTSNSIVATLDKADLTIISVKPQNLDTKLWSLLKNHVPKSSVILSIVAGIPISDFLKHSGSTQIVRSMPNTPVAVQSGMTVWCSSPDVPLEKLNSVAKFLNCMGQEVYVHDESLMDQATAISGSGPAYVLVILEALIDSAVHMGVPRNLATQLVLQTVYGTSVYAMKSGSHPTILRNEVTSPGGTTASALYVLEKGAFRTILADALWAAYRRSLELGNQNSNVGPGRSKHD